MRRSAAWGWSVALVVSTLVFALAIPRLAERGPQTITLTEDTAYAMASFLVTLPGGWELDIASTSGGVPAASDDGLQVRSEDAVWFGSSQDLVQRVADLAGASGTDIPDVPADSVGDTREVWTLYAPATDTKPARRIDVVRLYELVVLVISEGNADSLSRPEIEDIVDSVDFGDIPLEVSTASGARSTGLDDRALSELLS